MPLLQRTQALLSRVAGFGAGLSMAAIFAIVFVNAVRRYTIGKSFEWGEELPIYLGIYGMMLGAAVAYLQDRHIRFTVLVDRLSESGRRRAFVLVDLLVAVTGALLAWSGVLFVARRGGVEASGLIGRIRVLADASGQDWVLVVGHLGFWQSAIVAGGALVCLAGLFKGAGRLAARRP